MNLTGTVALVTGASRRVGRAIALRLADAGCDVAVHYHTAFKRAADTAAAIQALGRRACVFRADLADGNAAAELPDRVVGEMGRIDILVNNASRFDRVALADLDVGAWQRILAVNTVAPALLARAAAAHMARQGAGRIVNIADISADRPWPDYIGYCASKAALISMTRGLARALSPAILVNAVSPGVAAFPADMDDATRSRITARIPMNRAGSPQDVAEAVLFLVRDGDYVTGTVIAVDGGRGIAF
jgi:pteridine reductase